MTDILWKYTYRVVPNIKDTNYWKQFTTTHISDCIID